MIGTAGFLMGPICLGPREYPVCIHMFELYTPRERELKIHNQSFIKQRLLGKSVYSLGFAHGDLPT